mmetsp:Transcript_6687/g.15304  ORF Transcript_6687/g.15304 Transcript_6687/m.15304 type:complete len:210 (-) Transcript_6687:174-803(-)
MCAVAGRLLTLLTLLSWLSTLEALTSRLPWEALKSRFDKSRFWDSLSFWEKSRFWDLSKSRFDCPLLRRRLCSARAEMHLPSVCRDRLMLFISAMCSSLICCLVFHFSEPARSTRLNLDRNDTSPPSSATRLLSTCMVNMEWLREETRFMCVSRMALLSSAIFNRFSVSPTPFTLFSDSPCTYISLWSSRIDSGELMAPSLSMSYRFSL